MQNLNHAKLAKRNQCFTFVINGFLALQLQENICQGCPADLVIHSPLQETAVEVAEQICVTERARLSPTAKSSLAEAQTGIISMINTF